MKNKLLNVVKFGIGFLLLYWLLTQVRFETIVDYLYTLSPLVVLGVLMTTLGDYLCRFYSMHVLLNKSRPTSFIASVKIDSVLKFINFLTPSRFAGRSAGPLVVKHFTNLGWDDAVAVTVVQTIFYAGLYGAVTIIGISFIYNKVSIGLMIVFLFSTILYFVVAIGLIVAVIYIDPIRQIMKRFVLPYTPDSLKNKLGSKANKISEISQNSSESSAEIVEDKTVFSMFTLGWIGSTMMFPAMRVAFLIGELPDGITLWMLPFLLVVGYSVTLLPLTPGGIGIAEVSTTIVFVSLGFSESFIVTVILIDRFFKSYFASILGWFFTISMEI